MAIEKFVPNTRLKVSMAEGHLARTGHELEGYYEVTNDIAVLVRTCSCSSK